MLSGPWLNLKTHLKAVSFSLSQSFLYQKIPILSFIPRFTVPGPPLGCRGRAGGWLGVRLRGPRGIAVVGAELGGALRPGDGHLGATATDESA